MKTDRLIAILLYLLSHEKVTARELSAYFGVTPRTIYRDMEALDLAGVPIVSTQGLDGGYGIMESFTLNRTFFKEEELLSLFTALKGINAAIRDPAMESVLLKLRAITSKHARSGRSAEELPQVIYSPVPWGGTSSRAGHLETFRKAVQRRRVVSFTYTKTDGRSDVRRVEPLSLVLQADVWYLYGWDTGKRNYQFFRLSRVSQPCVEERSVFVRKPGKKPYPWETGWDTGPHVRFELRISANAAQKARDLFAWQECTAREDGSLEYRFDFSYDDWMESQILSFGRDVEVVHPAWLRARIRDISLKTAALYADEPEQ